MGVMHKPGQTGQKPREVTLDEIRSDMGDCPACQLYQTRTNIVFGVGNPRARVMFVGEAPGKNEDLRGEPFVGRAGENLNRILSLAGLEREDIYIANVLKCRPPQNRNPQADEVLACSPYLREQIRSIWPEPDGRAAQPGVPGAARGGRPHDRGVPGGTSRRRWSERGTCGCSRKRRHRQCAS